MNNDETFGKITRVVRLLTGGHFPREDYYYIRKMEEFEDRDCVICEVYDRGVMNEFIFPVEYLDWQNDKIVDDMRASLALHDEVLQDTRIRELEEQGGKLRVPIAVDIEQFDYFVENGLATPEDWFEAFDNLWPDRLLQTRQYVEKLFDPKKH